MLVDVYGEYDAALLPAVYLLGIELMFRGGDTYRVTVYRGGYQIGETCEKRDSREWVKWLRSL